MSENSKIRLYVGDLQRGEGEPAMIGEWVEFEGREVAEYKVNETQSYTVYSCKTSFGSSGYRLYMVDEWDMENPSYCLLPYKVGETSRDYEKPFELDELLAMYPIFERQLRSARTRSIDSG